MGALGVETRLFFHRVVFLLHINLSNNFRSRHCDSSAGPESSPSYGAVVTVPICLRVRIPGTISGSKCSPQTSPKSEKFAVFLYIYIQRPNLRSGIMQMDRRLSNMPEARRAEQNWRGSRFQLLKNDGGCVSIRLFYLSRSGIHAKSDVSLFKWCCLLLKEVSVLRGRNNGGMTI